MTSGTIKLRISEDVKSAMKARDKVRLAALRLMMAEFKRVEVDERVEIDDPRALEILDRMSKQRRDSLSQYKDAGRDDLVDQEQFELDVIAEYLPAQLSDGELGELIAAVIAETGAEGMADMGKVMGQLKPKVQGRADMGKISRQVKAALT
ncbi:MAG: glutamyl-tRNA amidotransferase [Gammaproteobacteria bacterium]|uniref:Glutamyl-tRNA amidotransferase n=1 Tax=OM182 bacterium MED-G24 TaxID=1986255 RepID=A0A2A5WIK7_9GAMM|nr:glutamyl-tRNA amidotransferase [Gammaproteobacteria bacterium]PDH36385.1 MAG: glutamyl-tRNA amidotransferase [OM182 bacterium MED-G24]RPG27629.1 MAG: GatB/YqeY domain-containing protein [Gammaproteobacteria bacterium TMED50]